MTRATRGSTRWIPNGHAQSTPGSARFRSNGFVRRNARRRQRDRAAMSFACCHQSSSSTCRRPTERACMRPFRRRASQRGSVAAFGYPWSEAAPDRVIMNRLVAEAHVEIAGKSSKGRPGRTRRVRYVQGPARREYLGSGEDVPLSRLKSGRRWPMKVTDRAAAIEDRTARRVGSSSPRRPPRPRFSQHLGTADNVCPSRPDLGFRMRSPQNGSLLAPSSERGELDVSKAGACAKRPPHDPAGPC